MWHIHESVVRLLTVKSVLQSEIEYFFTKIHGVITHIKHLNTPKYMHC